MSPSCRYPPSCCHRNYITYLRRTTGATYCVGCGSLNVDVREELPTVKDPGSRCLKSGDQSSEAIHKSVSSPHRRNTRRPTLNIAAIYNNLIAYNLISTFQCAPRRRVPRFLEGESQSSNGG